MKIYTVFFLAVLPLALASDSYQVKSNKRSTRLFNKHSKNFRKRYNKQMLHVADDGTFDSSQKNASGLSNKLLQLTRIPRSLSESHDYLKYPPATKSDWLHQEGSNKFETNIDQPRSISFNGYKIDVKPARSSIRIKVEQDEYGQKINIEPFEIGPQIQIWPDDPSKIRDNVYINEPFLQAFTSTPVNYPIGTLSNKENSHTAATDQNAVANLEYPSFSNAQNKNIVVTTESFSGIDVKNINADIHSASIIQTESFIMDNNIENFQNEGSGRDLESDLFSNADEGIAELLTKLPKSESSSLSADNTNVSVTLKSEGTARLLSIFSASNDTSAPCTTPKDEPGHCRNFRHCILQDVVSNFNIYLQYLCFVRPTFVGICCPDNPAIEVENSSEENATEVASEEKKFTQPPGGCGMSTKTRIVGGTISKPHEWTWMVALMRRNRFFCGGVIINNWYVLTAAHCVLGVNLRDIAVRLGEYNFNTRTEQQRDIPLAEIKKHAQFATVTFQHDIALLKLKHQIEYSKFIGAICLPTEEKSFVGVNATVVGWGTVSFGGAASPILRQVTIPVWANKDCDQTYVLENIDDSFMCAGTPNEEQDACQGDSGGPLMALNDVGRWEVIGIVSWGRRCGDPNFPGVYTRVTTYLNWISENLTL